MKNDFKIWKNFVQKSWQNLINFEVDMVTDTEGYQKKCNKLRKIFEAVLLSPRTSR